MKIVIIGNGIAGITAARFIRKQSAHDITVISDESPYFFSRTALMYIYMGHLREKDTQPYEPEFWVKNRINLKQGRVENINFDKKTLHFKGENTTLTYDKLVLATGSKPNFYGWEGQNLANVQGLYHLQDLEKMTEHTQNITSAVVVGGGLIGIEMAEMLASRGIKVHFLVREKSFWANVLPPEESEMLNTHIREHRINLYLGTELERIGDENNDGKADAVWTKSGEKIPCGFVGITVGVSPNVDFLKNTPLSIGRGILTNEYLETNIPDVYAIGDCAEVENPAEHRRSIEAVWYVGRKMGEIVADNICGKKTPYAPGIWFNSAKFFDIEYQVYGDIKPILSPQHKTIFWQHKDQKKAIRINYTEGGAVVGFNLMGIRYRHEVCDKWIRDKTPIETVLQNLSLANFDPEFFKEYEAALIALYNAKTGKNIHLKSTRRLDLVTRFLRK